MSVRVNEQTIHLEGRCRLEDAEVLLNALLQVPQGPIDVSAAETVHTALIQLIIASGRKIEGSWRNSFLGKFVVMRPPQGSQRGTEAPSPPLSQVPLSQR
jgi:hypothetical protein